MAKGHNLNKLGRGLMVDALGDVVSDEKLFKVEFSS